jgi:hypothetical protein
VPNCKLCEKFDEDTEEVWEGFTKQNQLIFDIFLACKNFNQLPCPGGVLNQDPWLMELFVKLSEIFEQGADCNNKEFQVNMLKTMLGARI